MGRACATLVLVFLQQLGHFRGAPPKVIVVGAGVSGMRTARLLTDRGYDVTVLEARTRICGRLYSARDEIAGSNGADVELGGGWIHGASDDHPIYKYMVTENSQQTFETNDELILQCDAEGTDVTETVGELWDPFATLLASAAQQATPSESLKDFMIRTDQTLTEKLGVQHWIASSPEAQTSADYSLVSAKHYTSGSEFSGTHGELLLKEGYDRICSLLKDSSSQLNVTLGKPVTSVRTSADGATVVAGSDTYTADAVVVTVPLGVLKKDPPAITFNPALPQAKLDAISGLGFGKFNKFFMYWDTQWWKGDKHYFGYIAEDQAQKAYLTTWLNAAAVSGTMKALCAISVGDGAAIADSKSDDEVKADAMAILRKINAKGLMHKDGSTDVPDPTQVLTVRWSNEQYTLGAYSYPTAQDADPAAFWNEMAKPEGRLVFAGEHTNAPYWATVHGAWLSGDRAASDVSSAVPYAGPGKTANVSQGAGAMFGPLAIFLVLLLSCFE